MRNKLKASLFFLFSFSSPAYSGCDDVAKSAMLEVAAGRKVTHADLKGCWGVIKEGSSINGSENIPLLSTIAAICSGIQNPQDLYAYLDGKSPWPPGEIESYIYWGWMWSSLVTLHNKCQDVLPEVAKKKVKRHLRATLGYHALHTVGSASAAPSIARVVWLNGSVTERLFKKDGFGGPWYHGPGMRSTNATGSDGYWIDRNNSDMLFCLALGYECEPNSAHRRGFPYELLNVLWNGKLRTDAKSWGITVDNQKRLREWIERPTWGNIKRFVGWFQDVLRPKGNVEHRIELGGKGLFSEELPLHNNVKSTQTGYVQGILVKENGVWVTIRTTKGHPWPRPSGSVWFVFGNSGGWKYIKVTP